MARGLVFCCATEYVVGQVLIVHPFDGSDEKAAAWLRVCSILAVRIFWGALRLSRGDYPGVAYGAPRCDGKWADINPEMKIVNEALSKLRRRARTTPSKAAGIHEV